MQLICLLDWERISLTLPLFPQKVTQSYYQTVHRGGMVAKWWWRIASTSYVGAELKYKSCGRLERVLSRRRNQERQCMALKGFFLQSGAINLELKGLTVFIKVSPLTAYPLLKKAGLIRTIDQVFPVYSIFLTHLPIYIGGEQMAVDHDLA